MKAMILAAGLGTRLRPLTDDRPKALVELNGRSMLEITIERLRSFGITELIVNVHHFADKIVDCLRVHNNFGLKVEVSREDELLDTGGGLKKAAYFFASLAASDEPFVLHNVDVLTNIDLHRMTQYHMENKALATLAVQERPSSRLLLFDERLRLCGRRMNGKDDEVVRECARPPALAFSGVHVISPRLLPLLTEHGAFSIIDAYLRLAAANESIIGFRAGEYYWRDLGKPESVAQAARDLQAKLVS